MKIVAAAAIALLAATQTPPVDEVVAKLDEYLSAYEPKLSELIADELLIQQISRSSSMGPQREVSTLRSRQRRQLSSEVAFVGLPNDAGWLGFRHVKTLDNRAVDEGSASLTSILSTASYDAARRLLADSAQHNLGLARTTNLPNLPLEFLHRRNRNRLLPRLDGRERVRGVDTARLIFVERVTPTLISNPNGNNMPSVIRAWVDPRTGALLRAEVTTFESAEAREFQSRIRVEFDRNKTLGLFVPIEMHESFPVPPPGRGTSDATYTNFRRFQTSARIVPPPQ